MYITGVHIKNIKSIKELKLSFSNPPGWHVLIGDNGSGKSSILKAIAMTLIGEKDLPALRLNSYDFISYDEKIGSIELAIYEPSPNFKQRHLASRYTIELRLEKDLEPFSETEDEVFSLFESSGTGKYAKERLDSNIFTASFGPFRRFSGGNKDWEKLYKSNPRTASHLSVFGEDVALTETLQWLIDLNYKSLEKDEDAEQTLKWVKQFINDGQLLPHNAKIHKVSSYGVSVKDGNNQSIPIENMSDGFRSILSLTLELIRQMVRMFGNKRVFQHLANGDIFIDIPGLVLIDEIDAHLHPTWQTRIGQWFLKYFPNIQFIVTTHSPLICRAAEKGTIWRLSAPGSNFETYEVQGAERDKLIYGNVLEAFGTEAFGQHVERSEKGQEKLEKLAELELKDTFGQLSSEEKEQMEQLQKIFTTDDRTEL